MEAHLLELDERGYTTFHNLLPQPLIDEARAQLQRTYDEPAAPDLPGSHPQDHEPGRCDLEKERGAKERGAREQERDRVVKRGGTGRSSLNG